MEFSNEDANCCGIFILIGVIFVVALIGFVIHDHYAEKAVIANFKTIVIPIDGAIVNTFGKLSAVWVKSENGAKVAVHPKSYLPPIFHESWDIVPIMIYDQP